MKEITAHLRYLRISPRKARLVADMVKGKSVKQAENILRLATKRASLPIKKLLGSAVANADHNFQMQKENLFVKTIYVNKGPTLKRSMPRSRGSASKINKRSSHITIILTTKK